MKNRLLLSSGRAATFHALALAKAGLGSSVLVPTYHCPTMVAPILLLGAQPCFYPIDATGLPDLERINFAEGTLAMIVPHYFGRAQSLAAVRGWCDERHIVLIEDCAHCFFGQAGELPVGAWGDYAIASVTKFLPVPEAGLLVSDHHPLPKLELQSAGLRMQVKGVVDLLELASQFGTLFGLNAVLRLLFRLKNRGRGKAANNQGNGSSESALASEMMQACDMARVNQKATWIAFLVLAMQPKRRIIARRQENYARYQLRFLGSAGLKPLSTGDVLASAPYVFPLWVETPAAADHIYHGLRRAGHAVFRWDRQWPGTPTLALDHGALWMRQVLQLLCHQDLELGAIESAAAATIALSLEVLQCDTLPVCDLP